MCEISIKYWRVRVASNLPRTEGIIFGNASESQGCTEVSYDTLKYNYQELKLFFYNHNLSDSLTWILVASARGLLMQNPHKLHIIQMLSKCSISRIIPRY
jgi:hypothetical protein